MMLLIELFRQKRIMVSLVAALVLVNLALVLFVALYQVPRMDAAMVKWNDLRRRNMSSSRIDVTALYRQAELDLVAIRTHIPQKREFPRVLGDLIDAAATSGVISNGISYKPLAISNEKLLLYQLTMTVNGTYAAIKSFLSDLQTSRDLLVVDSISLTNNDPFEENVSLELHLSLYLQEAS